VKSAISNLISKAKKAVDSKRESLKSVKSVKSALTKLFIR